MPISKCVKNLIDASKGKINAVEAKEILVKADELAKKIQAKEGISKEKAVEKAVAERIKSTKYYLDMQKQNQRRNVLKLNNLLDNSQNKIDNDNISIYDAVKIELVGTVDNIAGARNSIDSDQGAIMHTYMSRFTDELDKKKLFDILASTELSNEIATDLWALSVKDADKRIHSGNQDALEIAQIVHKMFNDMRNRMNKQGADIGEIEGFIVSQSHDVDRLFSAGKNEWIAFIKDRIDLDKSFEGNYDDIDETLSQAYEGIVTSIRKPNPKPEDSKLFQFNGVSNLGKKLSSKRKLIFKSAKDFLEYNERFGRNSLNEAIEYAVRNNSRNIALLERYGTNPEAMIKEYIHRLKERNRTRLAEGEKFNESFIKSAISLIVNSTDASSSPKLTNVVNNIKAFQMLRLMGGTAVSAITNVATKSIAYQYNGKSLLGSYAQYFNDKMNFAFKSEAEKRKFASMTGVFVEQYLSNINSHFKDAKTFGSKSQRAVNLFMKLNGMKWMDETDKVSMGATLAHDLGLQKDLPFDQLDTDTQRNFKLLDITSDDWDAMRSSVTTLEDGRDYIFSLSIPDIKIAEKLTKYFIDAVNFAIPQTGTASRARLALGTKKGERMYEILQLVTQFKSFSVEMFQRIWGRAAYQKSGTALMGMYAQIILSMTVMGYISMTAKDYLKGRTARDPYNLKTIFASIAQGGGLGVLADIFFTQEGSHGKRLSSIVLGPTFGTIQDAHDIYTTEISGGDSKALAFRNAIGLLPGQNLPYIRTPLNYLLLYSIQERLNPGSLQRMEKNVNKDYGQDFLLRPQG